MKEDLLRYIDKNCFIAYYISNRVVNLINMIDSGSKKAAGEQLPGDITSSLHLLLEGGVSGHSAVTENHLFPSQDSPESIVGAVRQALPKAHRDPTSTCEPDSVLNSVSSRANTDRFWTIPPLPEEM
jgi:hypothetical protein